jgi:hypothetical protein
MEISTLQATTDEEFDSFEVLDYLYCEASALVPALETPSVGGRPQRRRRVTNPPSLTNSNNRGEDR